MLVRLYIVSGKQIGDPVGRRGAGGGLMLAILDSSALSSTRTGLLLIDSDRRVVLVGAGGFDCVACSAAVRSLHPKPPINTIASMQLKLVSTIRITSGY